jgi:hypothetical protein
VTGINLSLVSHTNVGKTTLARTLLGRDIGEVGDTPHVTDLAEAHVMIENPAGERLLLWDTPGFGDSARLLKRLKQADNPLGWLRSQVWDRHRERPLWCSQQAIMNARDEADVILYLANAAEDPAAAGYVDLEMEVLRWIGKPILVLLNQTGPPRAPEEERIDEDRWREHLAPFALVHGVLAFDAFARCWVQEEVVLREIGKLVPAKRAAFERLAAVWRTRNLDRFGAALQVLGAQLAQAAADREPLEAQSWRAKAGSVLRVLGIGRERHESEELRAVGALAQRLDRQIRAATERLIALHGLAGQAGGEVLRRLAGTYATSMPVDEGFATVLGGLASGALTGLAGDLAAGGLTGGIGALVGAVAGGVGARRLARGYNLARGEVEAAVRWSEASLQGFVRSALLRYLAVAHYGRGRGDYAESEHPAFWQEEVAQAVAMHSGALAALWQRAAAGEADRLSGAYAEILGACAAQVLARLYPDAGPTEVAGAG